MLYCCQFGVLLLISDYLKINFKEILNANLLYSKCVCCDQCLVCMLTAVGVCLGMQCAVIEFARNMLHWQTANSTEVDPTTAHPVVCS